MDTLPYSQRAEYARDFSAADEAYRNGRVEATTKNKSKYSAAWGSYCRPLGVDPALAKDQTPFATQVRTVSGFAARVRRGYYGRGRQVATGTVSKALTAVGQTISMDTGRNPLKPEGSDKLLFPIQVMLDGMRKVDPPTMKKLPVEVDVPEFVVRMAYLIGGAIGAQAIADSILIAFYYLLRVGEYTCKGTRNESKQTVQFRTGDCTFFKKNSLGKLQQLSRWASAEDILAADSATLHLTNQKNGWKNVCINHHHNGDKLLSPTKAIARRYLHIRNNTVKADFLTTNLSAYFVDGCKYEVTDKDVRSALKYAAKKLNYPENKGIPIERVDTHSLRGGGANALSLAGYSDREIQKMGRWKSNTFKEYISDQLSNFSEGMSKSMKKRFNFVNIEGGVLHDVTNTAVNTPYTTNA